MIKIIKSKTEAFILLFKMTNKLIK